MRRCVLMSISPAAMWEARRRALLRGGVGLDLLAAAGRLHVRVACTAHRALGAFRPVGAPWRYKRQARLVCLQWPP